MIRRNQFVLNGASWSESGEPVRDVVQLQTPTGMVVNVEANDEPPLTLNRCACNAADRQADGDVPPQPDPNYGRLPGLFGSTPGGTDQQYDDIDAAEMARRCGKLRADLGLRGEDENPERARSHSRQDVDYGVQPVPGFPLRSRLAD